MKQDLKLFNVKFKVTEENQVYSNIQVYKNNMLDVLVFLKEDLKVSDKIVESIDEIESIKLSKEEKQLEMVSA